MKNLVFLFSVIAVAPVWAQSPVEWLDWSSDEGVKRLERSHFKVDFFPLANHFESQVNGVFCGPTSATIVLNTLRLANPQAVKPVDRTSISEEELKPMGKMNPFLARYSPFTFFNAETDKVKTRADVFGAKSLEDVGLSLDQLAGMLSAHQLQVTARHVDQTVSDDDVREAFKRNLATRGDYVIVNFTRKAFEPYQTGGGHISPVAAYDAKSDSFLVLDVNPTKGPWVWVSARLLIKAMRTTDNGKYRGYVLVSEKK